MCEEFSCLPSAAWQEYLRAPAGLLETILEYRAFAVTKSAIDRAQTKADMPSGEMTRLVLELDAEDIDDE